MLPLPKSTSRGCRLSFSYLKITPSIARRRQLLVTTTHPDMYRPPQFSRPAVHAHLLGSVRAGHAGTQTANNTKKNSSLVFCLLSLSPSLPSLLSLAQPLANGCAARIRLTQPSWACCPISPSRFPVACRWHHRPLSHVTATEPMVVIRSLRLWAVAIGGEGHDMSSSRHRDFKPTTVSRPRAHASYTE